MRDLLVRNFKDLFKNRRLPIGALLTGLYIGLSCLTIGLDVLRAYLFEQEFREKIIQSTVDGNLQRQQAIIHQFMDGPLKMVHQCKWLIQSAIPLYDTSILFSILTGMKFTRAIEKVSISLINNDILEVSRVPGIDHEHPRLKCMSSQKTSDGFMLRDGIYDTNGKEIKSSSFSFPNDVSKMRKNFSIFSFYEDMDSFPRFDEIKRSRDPLWLPPMEIFGPEQGLFVSLVSPLIDAQNSFIGIMSVSIPVNKFNDLMRKSVSQKAFEITGLFSDRGDAICFSDPDLILQIFSKEGHKKHTMRKISHHGISKIYENYVRQGHPSFIHLTHNKSRGHTQDVVYFHRLPDHLFSDWVLMSIVNYQELLKGKKDFLIISIKIILGISALAIIAILFVTRSIGAPITILSRHLSRLAQFQIPPPLAIKSRFNEIKNVVSSCSIVDKNFSIFYKLIPLSICKFLAAQKQELSIKGDSVNATTFFCDMAGFTHMAESMPPENVLSYLSRYFQHATTLVEQSKGIVQQYIGDAVFASWGDLIPLNNHESMACRCALQCTQDFSSQLNPLLTADGLPPLYVTFGIASGHVLAGTMGSSDHLQYSLIGENAALAQTLQECNRYYGTQILVQDSVYERVNQSFILRPVESISIGEQTVMMYELMADLSDSQTKNLSHLSYQAVQTGKAWSFYAGKEWVAAKEIYSSLVERFPDDKLAATMRDKCEAFSQMNPTSGPPKASPTRQSSRPTKDLKRPSDKSPTR